MATPPPPPSPKMPPKSVAPPTCTPPKAQQRARKTFNPVLWTGEDEGIKVVIYGSSGVGKTTLASLLMEHVDGRVIMIGLDDGGRMIRNVHTGEPFTHVPGIETVDDVRDALHQKDLFMPGDVCVIDTITKLEEVGEEYILRTIKKDKGATAKNIEDFGYGKGYKHTLDTLRLVLQDLDALVRRGVHVVLLAQEQAARITNSAGLDFLQAGPKLWHSNQYSSRLEVCEWADHVFRVAYHDTTVVAESTGGNQPARKGKITGGPQRAVYTAGAMHFTAKSRTISDPAYAVISFEDSGDDTLWQLLLGDRK